MDFKDVVKSRRQTLEYSLQYIADACGVSKSTVARWESGEIKDIKRDKISKLAKILNVDIADLMGWDDDKLPSPAIAEETVSIPVIGEIAAGYDNLAYEDWCGDTEEIPISFLKGRKKEDYFFLTVKGNSMYPLYLNGDKVLILKQTTLNDSGDIGAVIYDDEIATLKKVEYKVGEDWIKLIPLNLEYPPKLIEGEALEHCRIIGIPKLLIRDLNEK